MFKNLFAGAIGIKGKSLPDIIKLAADTGYAGIDFDIREAEALAKAHSVSYVRDLFEQAGVMPGLWGLPVAWNQDSWQDDLADLPRLAELGVELGCTRVATWCPSWSDTLDYDANWAWHVSRLRPIGDVLSDAGCSFGIEFLGPKTLLDGHRYGFIRTMPEMLKLAADIGTGNVGLLLDAWHLYTSGGSAADLATLKVDDVVTVHINDAPVGTPVDELIDTRRFLPLETGGIDLVAFMTALADLGYEGPVTTEPFNERINAVAARDPAAAAREVSDAMTELWKRSGLEA